MRQRGGGARADSLAVLIAAAALIFGALLLTVLLALSVLLPHTPSS